ncbi:MAG TPA: hypothetical protein VII50_07120, partial [Acidothermaceae bacterium]
MITSKSASGRIERDAVRSRPGKQRHTTEQRPQPSSTHVRESQDEERDAKNNTGDQGDGLP